MTLATNAIVAWMTDYLGLAINQLRAAGQPVDEAALAHLSPAQTSAVHFFGTIPLDIDSELASLDPTGYRPLRHATSTPPR